MLDPMYTADPAAAVEVFEIPLPTPSPVIATEEEEEDGDDDGGVDTGDNSGLDPVLSSKIMKASTP